MSGRKVDVGRRDQYSSFLPVKMRAVSIMLRSRVHCWITVLERVILCVVFAVGPLLSPTSTSCPPDVIHVMYAPTPRPSVFFAGLPLLCIIMNTN